MGFVKPGRKIGGLVLFYKSMVKRLKGFLSFFFKKKEVCGDRKRATHLFFRFVFLTLDQLIVCFNVHCRAISP